MLHMEGNCISLNNISYENLYFKVHVRGVWERFNLLMIRYNKKLKEMESASRVSLEKSH